ncbi:hypothetical protein [Kitasatospora sp. NPDC097643]|uniref:hypothetical protein n=1 Tax=Kitasatospora sp. NPDC097643 TaxID=3157230 RepID=UPI003332BBBD
MRANHASRPQEPAPRGVARARRTPGRWLPRPRAVAAGGALLAQLWGLGATGAYAAADPLPEQANPTVRRTLGGGTAVGGAAVDGTGAGEAVGGAAHDGPAHDGTSAGPGHQPAGQTAHTPGLVGELTGTGGAPDTVPGAVGGVLQDRIRAGGLPLPGQRAAVPDAFAIASGLLGSVPAQAHPADTRAPRNGEPAAPATTPHSGSGSRPGHPGAPAPTARPTGAGAAPPARENAARDGHGAPGPATASGRAGGTTPVPVGTGTPETLALSDTATVTAVDDGAGSTATAVLAPIAAGLLLTGAAMCKHRGLPRGH